MRTRSATSGSSEAVGSSSTSSGAGAGSTWRCRPASSGPTTGRRRPASARWPRRKRSRLVAAAAAGLGPAQAVEAAEELERLPHLELLGQGQVAGHEADLGHRPGPALRDAGGRGCRSCRPSGGDHAEEHQQRRGLAGAVGAEEGDPLPGLHVEVDTIDGATDPELASPRSRRQDHPHRRERADSAAVGPHENCGSERATATV